MSEGSPQVICLGEIIMDFFPMEIGRNIAEVSGFAPKPGGAPANVAVALSRLGIPSAFIGKVGDDAFGYHLIEVLKDQRVDTRGMRIDPDARTTLAFIAMPNENTNEFVFYRNPGADLMLREDELDVDLIENARALHIGSLSLVMEPAQTATMAALRRARKSNALISFDVNYRPTLWKSPEAALDQIQRMLPLVDLLKINEYELKLLSGCGRIDSVDEIYSACQMLLTRGPKIIAVTLGPLGSYFCCSGGAGYMPGFRVKTIDATGCGDAFTAGLLSQLIRDSSWQSCLTQEYLQMAFRYANAVGALTALSQGVIPALPSFSQVDRFLGSDPCPDTYDPMKYPNN